MQSPPLSTVDAAEQYPTERAARDRWILARRPARNHVRLDRPNGCWLEPERADSGEIVSIATVLLANRECPWRCLMCDLWKSTTVETLPAGTIPKQIDFALERLAASPGQSTLVRQIKLYNAGSFFDPEAIPRAEYGAIAERLRSFERVIVESHPALVREPALRFRDALAESCPHPPRLEVAMGLETIEPDVLARLNKRMTVADFARAAEFLDRHEIAMRAFVLVQPPFMDAVAALEWAKRSTEFAFSVNATVVSLIPTRLGNGALDALRRLGQFSPPCLETLEAAQAHGINRKQGRVFADLWDLENFSRCPGCFEARRDRLQAMNHQQVILPEVACPACAERFQNE